MNIGEKIKKARLEKGLTQKELGELLGVSQAMIGQYEKGLRNPKRETLIKIATALTVPTSSLYDDYEFIDPNESTSEKQEEYYKQQLETFKKHFAHKRIELLLSNYDSVNEEGQKKIVDYSSDIADNPKYKKDPTE